VSDTEFLEKVALEWVASTKGRMLMLLKAGVIAEFEKTFPDRFEVTPFEVMGRSVRRWPTSFGDIVIVEVPT
jgi:hypothetical protein